MRLVRLASTIVMLAFAAVPAGAVPGQGAAVVRVVTATTPDIVSIPDTRAFEVFLPQEHPGTRATVTYMAGASRAIHALIAGEADVAIATLPAGLLAVEGGQEIVAFSLASGARPYLEMVAHRDVRHWHDLVGREVAIIGPVDATHYLAQMQLRRAGVDPESVVWRAVGGGGGRMNALVSGVAKASLLQSAQALRLVSQGPFHVLAPPGGKMGDFIFKVFWARPSFLREHPVLARAIAAAHFRSVREALDRAHFLGLAARILHPMPREVIERAYDLMRRRGIWDREAELFSQRAGDRTVAELVRAEVLAEPIAFGRWATTEFAHAAATGRRQKR